MMQSSTAIVVSFNLEEELPIGKEFSPLGEIITLEKGIISVVEEMEVNDRGDKSPRTEWLPASWR